MRTTTLTTPLGNDVFGEPTLLFYQLKGREALNTLFDYTLTVYSSQSDIAPSTILGQAVTIYIQDQYGNLQYLNAIVAEFKYVSVDVRRHEFEAKTAYEAKLVPWLALAKYSHDCKIFQNMTIPQIVAEVLGKYSFPVKQNLQGKYETLVFTVQYNESDYDFIARLLERAGIGYHFSHSDSGHVLVLTDSSLAYTTIPGHETVAYRGLDDSHSDVESISSMTLEQIIKTGLFTTGDYWYRQPYATFKQMDGGTYEAKNHPFDEQEIYHWHGQGHFNDWDVGANIAKINQDRQHNQFRVMQGECNVRAFVVGATGSIFTLQDHPRDDANGQLVILATETYIKESLSAAGDAGEHTDWDVKFTVMPEQYQYRPQHVTRLPKIYGPQSAIVTGPGGQEIWTNDLSEVKLRFLWDRYSSGDENSSKWIRVGSTWAGAAWGQNEIPRIGQEVIVNYLDGNPDNPIVTSRVVNSSQPPPSFSNVGSLPGNQALSGIKSKEFGGGRYNQLLMDDTNGQIRMQVASEHAKSQLNLGYLTYPRNNGTANPRGEGAELRSDAWAAVRAAKGVFISAEGQFEANGIALSREEIISVLEQALSLAKDLGRFAAKNDANPSDFKPQEELSKAVKNWGKGSNAEKEDKTEKDDKTEKGGSPIITVSAPSGISLGTPQDVTIAAGDHIDLVAQKNQHLSAGQKINLNAVHGISLFSAKDGIKSIAHAGNNLIQANNDDVQLVADENVTITAVRDHVMIAAAKHITLTSGGGYIKIADGNIEIHCPGTIDMKAGNYTMDGPTSFGAELPALPPNKLYDEQFVVKDKETGMPLPHIAYRIVAEDGETVRGITDEEGRTERVVSDTKKKISLYFD